MAKSNVDQATQQFESMFFGPARAYAGLALQYTEQVVTTQLEFAKACTEANLNQARAFLDIKDPESFRTYFEGQQKVAKDLTERLQGDTEKVVAMNQEFMQKSQELVEDSAKTASKTATK